VRLIYDPIAIKIIERQLKRPLDDYEKAGEKSVWLSGELVFLQIPQVVFPHGLMPSTHQPANNDKVFKQAVLNYNKERGTNENTIRRRNGGSK
jgi:hypothetical protein